MDGGREILNDNMIFQQQFQSPHWHDVKPSEKKGIMFVQNLVTLITNGMDKGREASKFRSPNPIKINSGLSKSLPLTFSKPTVVFVQAIGIVSENASFRE
ncbi:unnamed protein product [Dovyalis caffra]|uniref:Uncharacterized protein n=1 Tax=Dovyalis caffra TaxID=77055 RepID=A0AAV1SFX5_9ROSI|nr:unnamed protein product [Dovyalis caffra]